MRITDRLTGDINVLCIACDTFRRLGHMVVDLDGPSFVAYFCDDTCVPASSWHADRLYTEAGFRRNDEGEWRKAELT